MVLSVHFRHEQFRRLVADVVAARRRVPELAATDWVVACHDCLSEFQRRFPTTAAQEAVVRDLAGIFGTVQKSVAAAFPS
jgi:hypothetical protein